MEEVQVEVKQRQRMEVISNSNSNSLMHLAKDIPKVEELAVVVEEVEVEVEEVEGSVTQQKMRTREQQEQQRRTVLQVHRLQQIRLPVVLVLMEERLQQLLRIRKDTLNNKL